MSGVEMKIKSNRGGLRGRVWGKGKKKGGGEWGRGRRRGCAKNIEETVRGSVRERER